MKLQKLALTALAMSVSAAFAAGYSTDKQAQGSSSNQASMASGNQPSSSSAGQAASTNGSQPGMSSQDAAQADPQVRQVQQALKDKGHDPGPVDGVMGPKTQQALQGFQQQQGISGSGQLDQQTLAALGVQGNGASGSSISSSSNEGSSSTNQTKQ